MKIQQKKFSQAHGWELIRSCPCDPNEFQLVIAFAAPDLLDEFPVYEQIRSHYPKADILLSSTAGEIIDTQVNDHSVSLTAIAFNHTAIRSAVTHITQAGGSLEAGRTLAAAFDPQGLRSVFVISDGQKVNGSELVLGLQERLPQGVILTGGLAGDGARFYRTLVGLNEMPLEGRIAAIGFYGDRLSISCGSVGGWDPFGPERLITRSRSNVLYELDEKPALDVYKLYLGEHAAELPGSGLLFPLSIRSERNGQALVRTILSINEEEKSLTFAGNMPEGAYARLMKASFDRLIEGAANAAQHSMKKRRTDPGLAILISCVGRKLVLDQRVEEEVEVVRAAYGPGTAITGFYSYGEISPAAGFMKCELHNQTMTITTLTEE